MAEPAQRSQHRLPLGVGDLRLQDDVDDHPCHAAEPTGARPIAPALPTGRPPGDIADLAPWAPYRARSPISAAEGAQDGGNHLVRPSQHVRGAEPQDRPARRDERVLAA